MICTEAQFIGLAAFEHSVMTTFLLFVITSMSVMLVKSFYNLYKHVGHFTIYV